MSQTDTPPAATAAPAPTPRAPQNLDYDSSDSQSSILFQVNVRAIFHP